MRSGWATTVSAATAIKTKICTTLRNDILQIIMRLSSSFTQRRKGRRKGAKRTAMSSCFASLRLPLRLCEKQLATNMIKLEGSQLAARIKQDVQTAIERMVQEQDVRPGLAAVRVGDDPASAIYVR